MLYRVCFEKTVSTEVVAEASSYEEAVAVAMKRKPTEVATDLTATWVAAEKKLQETGEYEYQVLGPCLRCKIPIVDRDIPNQPWTYGSDQDHKGLVCYKCMRVSRESSSAGH